MRTRPLVVSIVVLILFVCAAIVPRAQVPPPVFTDAKRGATLATAFPEVERIFTTWIERAHVPGAAMGIIVDGELAWVHTAGVSDTVAKRPVTPDTVFRIASMTKSFTALAILKLRDEGKLSLDDRVATYVPELASLKYPTEDSPAITIRHLLSHSEGFPEDNPWGDRQLARTQAEISAWMRQGIPFSTAPGTAFEYSNFGFAILGQVVERVAKRPYAEYITQQILLPLGMRDTTFERARIPSDRMARGYRWEDNAWVEEPMLPHGTFGAMGGIWTSTRDLARYVVYHMSAWPPRDGADNGPVKRSSLREQQQVARWEPGRATRRAVSEPLELSGGGYGFGLAISQSCRFQYIVDHGGGLPGYGSLMLWLPDYGVGLIGMANRTYAGWHGVFTDSLAALAKTGALKPRVVQPSPALVQAKADVSRLVTRWDAALADKIAADNLFLDQNAERRAARVRELAEAHGACTPDSAIEADNALRGTWRMTCERGWLNVGITLAPTEPPRVQFLRVQSVLPPGREMTAAIEAARPRIAAETAGWGTCRVGEAVGGDGVTTSVVRLACERGQLDARLALDPGTHELTQLTLMPDFGAACVP